MIVYKILTQNEWRLLCRDGETAGSRDDLASGFVHLSTGAQVARTAAKHFPGLSRLVLIALEAEALGPELRWEAAHEGAEAYPHLYRRLSLDDSVWLHDLPVGPDGLHVFPPGVVEG